MRQDQLTKNAMGWDMTFATNHLGPFAFTEALIPHLPDGAHVVFICSAVENPERRPAKAAGFRGGRYISAVASARGEWSPGGSANIGWDAYATSKQCNLATVLAFARETSRLRFSAIEPGVSPSTGLGGATGGLGRSIATVLFAALAPFVKYLTTPQRAADVIARVVTDASARSGIYYDEMGRPMRGSTLVHDPAFQDRVVAETRALLSMAAQQRAAK